MMARCRFSRCFMAGSARTGGSRQFMRNSTPNILRLQNNVGILALLALTTSFPSIAIDLLIPGVPRLASDLQVSPEQAKLTVQGFFLGFAIAHLFVGQMADSYGRRSVLLSGIAVFTAASVACATTGDLTVLLVLRFVQGVSGAAGVILARTVIRDIYGPERTTKAMSTMFMIFVPIPIVMPVVGGALVGNFGWQAVFVTMGVIGLVAGVIVFRYLPETLAPASGAALENRGWLKTPGLILGNRSFMRNSLAVMFCFGAVVLMLSELPHILSRHFGYGPQELGFAFALIGAALAAGVYAVRALVPRVGIDGAIYLGLFAMVLGWSCVLGLALIGFRELTYLAPQAVAASVGMGILMSLAAGQAMVPFAANAGAASSFYGALLYGGSTLLAWLAGLVVGGSIVVLSAAISLLTLVSLVIFRFLRN